ncbi:hypothetical protein [Streptomyces sp. NPDC090022]|uniref:hypothetical protein n=1 Tax=Streptomyces sp. NPDC090022 TaxID=3365920 RepID=UPI003822FEB0
MSARRPLLTALGATTLLGALWFVPSANATAPGDTPGGPVAPASANAPAGTADPRAATTAATTTAATTATTDETQLTLAATGGVDTTPYVLGGTMCLGIGAAFVAFSARRARAL